jgi:hypothetical protein
MRAATGLWLAICVSEVCGENDDGGERGAQERFLSSQASTYTVSLGGGFLVRGFWIYVWEVRDPEGSVMLYVGRTGDSSSPNAQSPFNRMGQHLGFAKNSSSGRSARGTSVNAGSRRRSRSSRP